MMCSSGWGKEDTARSRRVATDGRLGGCIIFGPGQKALPTSLIRCAQVVLCCCCLLCPSGPGSAMCGRGGIAGGRRNQGSKLPWGGGRKGMWAPPGSALARPSVLCEAV